MNKKDKKDINEFSNWAKQKYKTCKCDGKKRPLFVDLEEERLITECKMCHRIYVSKLTKLHY